jgi:putative nucleotidyltransferase with HDIG domain
LALRKQNLRRLLLTFEALADLGPTLTSQPDFSAAARTMLVSVLEAVGAREGVLFAFNDKPAVLRSMAVHGLAVIPDPAVIPLLPKHVHALSSARGPQLLAPHDRRDIFLSSNGNVAPELFKCLVPLAVASRLVGVIALGRPLDSEQYDDDSLDAMALIGNYVALAVHNQQLSHTLELRVRENLRLLASAHTFYDSALETFAAAIDIKHIHIEGHSLRVARYAAGIAETLGLDSNEVAGIRAAAYLHDIGKVAVDKRLFGKPERLDPEEFREMADHTTVGHRIVSGVHFPWPQVSDVVRWHHERSDGTGYPDRLRLEDTPVSARIVALADTFDAMTTDRPYRAGMTVGAVMSELVQLGAQKYDPAALQALLIQIRRDAVDPNHRFLDERVLCNIAPADVDHLASNLSYRLSNARAYLS